MPHSYLAQYGPDLLRRGYDIIPIGAESKKPPGQDQYGDKYLKGWTKIQATQSKIKDWMMHYPGAGVGILTKNTPAVDLDVYDPAIVEKLKKWCMKNIGKTASRIGQEPKLLMIYRSDEPFSKLMSTMYEDPEGRRNRIEILGEGQQFVAFSIHPDTKKPYRWINKTPLSAIAPEKLPVLTKEKAEELIAYFETLVPKTWKLYVKQSRKPGAQNSGESRSPATENSDPDYDTSFDNNTPKVNISEDNALEKVMKLEATEYEEWCEVGMALYHQYDGSEIGFNMWNEWSKENGALQRTKKAHKNYSVKKWPSFKQDPKNGPPLTFRSVLAMVKNKERKINVLDSFLKRYIYIADTGKGEFVHDLDRPPHQLPMKYASFKNFEADKVEEVEVPAPTMKDPHRTKVVNVLTATRWMKQTDKLKVIGSKYMPTKKKERIISDIYNQKWLNEFYMPEFPSTSKVDQLSVFVNHMNYLFPIKEERDWFVGWMALNVQFPEMRCKTVPLHISIEHGTGRGWLVKLIGALLGTWNVSNTKMESLYSHRGNAVYNNYLDRSLVCAIEEVREGAMRFEVSEHIRDILIEDRLEVNIKGGTKNTQDVYTNFFFMSNHPDALVLKKEDRRINVFKGVHPPNDKEYYDRLYNWLGPSIDEPSNAVGQLFWYLRKYDLNKFKGERCFKNEAREVLIQNNMTETEDIFWQVVNSGKLPKKIHLDEVMEIMVQVLAGDGEDTFGISVDEKQVVHLLQTIGKKDEVQWLPINSIRKKGRTARPWVIDDKHVGLKGV